MVDITPFRAVRYDEAKVGRLDAVLAPPYDVISPEQQDVLYARHPNNIVRIDLNKAEPGDGEKSRYARAASILAEWLATGIFVEDKAPAVYVLAQTFTGPDGVTRTRTGFFGRARLTRWDDGPILPHERTLRGPKVDRLELFRATRTNLSPIFGAYQDGNGQVAAILDAAKRGTPVVDATMDGVRNQLWRVSEPDANEALSDAFAEKKLYIADGHHRYETGLAYRDERRAHARSEGAMRVAGEEPAYDHILMFSCAVEDPGMVIFPTHRLVHGVEGFDAAAFLAKADRWFERAPAPADDAAAQAALRKAGEGANAYLVVTRGERHLLRSRAAAPWDEVPSLPAHAALRRLDVSVLHSVLLEHVLGISREAQATQANLRYSKDFGEALRKGAEPEVQAAFLMNPTKIGEVIAVAESGEVMPQKSTFFYPKIPSGLVLYPLD